ncbi:MAG: hypothetical protein ACFCUT_06725 [Kiloniellaceae bacterium]
MHRGNVTATDVAVAFEDMKRAYLDLMQEEGVDDPRELLRIRKVTPAVRRASEAADRFLEMFAACDGHLADWTGVRSNASTS